MELHEQVGRLRDAVFGGRQATVDTAAIPAVSLLQPIDLTDEAAVTEILDVAVTVGEILLDAGTGAIDTSAQVRMVASAYGLDAEVDVTYDSIQIWAGRGRTLPAVTAMRRVTKRSLDYTRLGHVDGVVRRIVDGRLAPDEASERLAEIVSAPHPYSRWVAVLGWAAMGASITFLVGGSAPIAAVSLATTALIYAINRGLGRLGLPFFFQQVVGGFFATLPAIVVYRLSIAFDWDVEPYRMTVAGIVVLLAGLSLVGSVQDAITGAPVTAAARFFEVLVFTGGVVAGVGLALKVGSQLGASLPPLDQSGLSFAPLPIAVLAGGATATAFGVASYAQRRALAASFLSGGVGALVAGGMMNTGFGPVVASGTAAVVVGFAGGLLARRAVVPPIIVAVAGITPLVPGLAVYRAISQILEDQTSAALSSMVSALAIGCSLAAGVTLGEWMARTARRPRITMSLGDIHRPRVVLDRRRGRPRRLRVVDAEPEDLA